MRSINRASGVLGGFDIKARIIVGLLLTPVLFIVLYFTPPWCLPLAISVVSMLCVQELLGVSRFARCRRIIIYASAFSAFVPLYYYLNLPRYCLIAGVFVFVALMFAEGLANHEETPFSVIGGAFMVSWLFPLFLSTIMFVAHGEFGKYTVMLIFIIPIITDIFAMQMGMLFGKHKLSPSISPKKTVEGSVGGLICAILFTLLYGLILQYFFEFSVHYIWLAAIAAAGSVAGQFGDLAFSFIKREFKVKDFGALLPGHGGILDRFDSLLFSAPLIYAALTAFEVIW